MNLKHYIKIFIIFLFSFILGFFIYHFVLIDLLPLVEVQIDNIFMGLTFYILTSLLVFIFFKFLLKEYSKKDFIFLFVLYLSILILGLTCRTRNVRGFEWNPFSFFKDFINYKRSLFVTIINLLGFVPAYPLGSLLSKKLTFKLGLLLTVFFSIIMEVSQYIFRVGIFSTSDILLYISGYIIGFLAMKFILAEKN